MKSMQCFTNIFPRHDIQVLTNRIEEWNRKTYEKMYIEFHHRHLFCLLFVAISLVCVTVILTNQIHGLVRHAHVPQMRGKNAPTRGEMGCMCRKARVCARGFIDVYCIVSIIYKSNTSMILKKKVY
jgi:hypothetical protein